VTRTGASTGAVSATVSLADGTATSPADYTNAPIVVSFAAGDVAPKTITIPIIDDVLVEGDETVSLTLGSPTGNASIGTQSTAILNITDNDIAPPPPAPAPLSASGGETMRTQSSLALVYDPLTGNAPNSGFPQSDNNKVTDDLVSNFLTNSFGNVGVPGGSGSPAVKTTYEDLIRKSRAGLLSASSVKDDSEKWWDAPAQVVGDPRLNLIARIAG
jgi:hypothetical protein